MHFQESKFSKTIPFGKIEGVAYTNDQLSIGYNSSTFLQKTSFDASDTKDIVRLHFGLKGDYSFYYKQLNRSFDLIGGHYNLMYSPAFDISVSNKKPEINTLGISFDRNYFLNLIQSEEKNLQSFKSKIARKEAAIFLPTWVSIQAPMEQLFQDLIHCPFEGKLKDSFLQSRSIELLIAVTSNTTFKKENNFIKVKGDKEKIIDARDYINAHISEAPNLSAVAKSIGLNEFKLKHGFKEIFGTTLFGYLTERRWQLAQRYLLDSSLSMVAISELLGYATPQHFNNMFKKRFGETPNIFRKNPKNAIQVP